jgi:hypothetical protein
VTVGFLAIASRDCHTHAARRSGILVCDEVALIRVILTDLLFLERTLEIECDIDVFFFYPRAKDMHEQQMRWRGSVVFVGWIGSDSEMDGIGHASSFVKKPVVNISAVARQRFGKMLSRV